MKALLYATVACLSMSTVCLAQPRTISGRIYGDTIDTTSGISATITALRDLTINQRTLPTTRVVFDETVQASSYTSALTNLHPYTYIMGEILDSQYMTTCDQTCYDNRTDNYLNMLGNKVDVWEVGNEVNGEWAATNANNQIPTTAQTAAVVAKIHDAYLKVKSIGGKASLTLYWNGPPDDGTASCWSNKNNSMLVWANANIPSDMKQGLDYVLVSYYGGDCGPVSKVEATYKDVSQYWHDNVFLPLQQMFPNSKIGFGENGVGGSRTATLAQKQTAMNRYYAFHFADLPNYISGNFWWYWKEDCVPDSTKALWQTFNTVTNTN